MTPTEAAERTAWCIYNTVGGKRYYLASRTSSWGSQGGVGKLVSRSRGQALLFDSRLEAEQVMRAEYGKYDDPEIEHFVPETA